VRIHRIKLSNYRGVSQAEVMFPAQGVTIVEGDNEVGKTSLSEAIDLLLAEQGMAPYLALGEALFGCGAGRSLTVIAAPAA